MAIINMGGGGKAKIAYPEQDYPHNPQDSILTIQIKETYTYPTNIDGVELNSTFSRPTIPGLANEIGNIWEPCRIFEKVVIPAHYTTVNLYQLNTDQRRQDIALRHLVCEAQSLYNNQMPYNFTRQQLLDALELPNWNFSYLDLKIGTGDTNNPYWEHPFALIAPKVQAFGGQWGASGHLFEWSELNVEGALRIGNTNGNINFNRYWKSGSWRFTQCTSIIQIEQGEEEQTMRFPKLTTCNNTNMFRQDWSHGKFIWCVGKDLATLNSTTAGNIIASHTNGLGDPIILHIPEGPSVTKNTLDSYSMVEGVHYIRDYGTDACYPEDAQYFS